MDWNKLAADLMIALQPILLAVAIALIGAGFEWVRNHSAALKASKAFAALEAVVEAEVTAASTASVNPLKANGKWTPEMGAQIKDAVAQKVLARLPGDTKSVLQAFVGDVGGVIGSKIEHAVAANQASGVQAKVAAGANPPSSQPSTSTA